MAHFWGGKHKYTLKRKNSHAFSCYCKLASPVSPVDTEKCLFAAWSRAVSGPAQQMLCIYSVLALSSRYSLTVLLSKPL